MTKDIGRTHVGRSGRHGASGSDIALTVIASIAIALPLVFYLHQHVEILRLGYEIQSLQDRRVDLVERSRELRVRRMESSNLARVEHEAGLMGLVPPDPTKVYVATAASGARGDAPPANGRDREAPMTARLE